MHPVRLREMMLDIKSNSIVLIIAEENSDRYAPIWIGNPEAYAIAMALSGVKPPRPMTHDLLISVLEGLQVKIDKVVLSGLKENIFYALLHLVSDSGGRVVIDARPSDSIALAVRTGSPIFIADDFPMIDPVDNPDENSRLAERFRKIEPSDLIF